MRVRAEIAKSLAATATVGMGIMTMAHYAGFEVGLDVRNGDFGKIKIGNTRIDVWGGLVQPMRLVVAAGTGMSEHFGWLPKGKTEINPLELLGRFSIYKSAPVVGLGLELGFGRNVMWQKVPLKQIPAEALMPLVFQDIVDAYNDAGLGRAAVVGGLTFFGVGANTYQQKGKRPPGMGGPPRPPQMRP